MDARLHHYRGFGITVRCLQPVVPEVSFGASFAVVPNAPFGESWQMFEAQRFSTREIALASALRHAMSTVDARLSGRSAEIASYFRQDTGNASRKRYGLPASPQWEGSFRLAH